MTWEFIGIEFLLVMGIVIFLYGYLGLKISIVEFQIKAFDLIHNDKEDEVKIYVYPHAISMAFGLIIMINAILQLMR